MSLPRRAPDRGPHLRATPPRRAGRYPTGPADALERALAASGFKRSHARGAVIAALLEASGHVTAQDLLGLARKRQPSVSSSTVYRALAALVAVGLVNARDFSDGPSRYELARGDHHDHLICTRCGDVEEFAQPIIEELQVEVARSHDFELVTHRLELYGVCARCRAAAGEPREPPP